MLWPSGLFPKKQKIEQGALPMGPTAFGLSLGSVSQMSQSEGEPELQAPQRRLPRGGFLMEGLAHDLFQGGFQLQ